MTRAIPQSSSQLDDYTAHSIYISNAKWRRSVFFFAGSGATGINDFKKTRNYASSRLLSAFMLEREHLTLDQLLASTLTAEQALAQMNPPEGKTCEQFSRSEDPTCPPRSGSLAIPTPWIARSQCDRVVRDRAAPGGQ